MEGGRRDRFAGRVDAGTARGHRIVARGPDDIQSIDASSAVDGDAGDYGAVCAFGGVARSEWIALGEIDGEGVIASAADEINGRSGREHELLHLGAIERDIVVNAIDIFDERDGVVGRGIGAAGKRNRRGSADAGQVGNQILGNGGAEAGDQVIARAGVGIPAIAAGSDVMKISGRQLIQIGQRLRRAVQRSLTTQSPVLIHHGHEPRPERRRKTRAAEFDPGVAAAKVP